MSALVRELEVDRDGESLVLAWNPGGDGPVDIAIGPTPDAASHTHTVTVEGDRGRARLPVPGLARSYLSVSSGGQPALVVAERRLPFEAVVNFRDLGGYPTTDGRRTRWGQVFRSDALHRMTASDLKAYESLGVRAVYDLRGSVERERDPDPFPSVQISLMAEAEASSTDELDWVRAQDREGGEAILRGVYRSMLANSAPLLGRLLSGLADAALLPAVFHCTGGKDRTGVSAALLLELLGVDRAVVLDDYELTGRFRRREHQEESYQNMLATGMGPEAAAVVLGCPRWVMAETLDVLDRDFGGVVSYATGVAGMAPDRVERLSDLLTI